MCKLLMSINPEHVENILAGRKTTLFVCNYQHNSREYCKTIKMRKR